MSEQSEQKVTSMRSILIDQMNKDIYDHKRRLEPKPISSLERERRLKHSCKLKRRLKFTPRLELEPVRRPEPEPESDPEL